MKKGTWLKAASCCLFLGAILFSSYGMSLPTSVLHKTVNKPDPIFKKKISSFSKECNEQSLLLHYYQQSIKQLLVCAGLNEMQTKQSLAQIDFLLETQQHESLHHATLLTPKNITLLEELTKTTKALIDKQENTKAAISIQKQVRGYLVRKNIIPLKREEKSILRIRSQQFQTLLNSESNYLAFLEVIHEEYTSPLLSNPSSFLTSHTAAKYLASNINKLIAHHTWFRHELKRLQAHSLFPLKIPLGELILECQVKIRSLYLAYGSQFVHSLETARYLNTVSSSFQQLGINKESGQKEYELEELLKLPLQYINYFAKKLFHLHNCSCSCTEKESASLGKSIGKVESIAFALSEILVQQEDPVTYNGIKQTLLVELTIEGLEDPLRGTSPDRKFLKEGTVRIRKHKGQGKQCQIFIFNDVIIIAKKRHDSLKFHTKIYPNELMVLEEHSSKLVIHRNLPNDDREDINESWIFKNHKSEAAEWIELLRDFMNFYTRNKVFGVLLEEVIEREQSKNPIPFVLSITMDYIREYGMQTEGIFRVPGELMVIDNFKRAFDLGSSIVDFRGCTVHDVAALLKLFLRELPEPLLLYSNFDGLVSIQKKFNMEKDSAVYRTSLILLIADLPLAHSRVLAEILRLFHELAEHNEHTKMGCSQFALMIAPNIIRPKLETIDSTMNGLILSRLVEYLIINWKGLWDGVMKENPRVLPEDEWSDASCVQNRYSLNRTSITDSFDPLLVSVLPFPQTLGLKVLSSSAKIDFSTATPDKKRKQKIVAKTSPRKKRSPLSLSLTHKVAPLKSPRSSVSPIKEAKLPKEPKIPKEPKLAKESSGSVRRKKKLPTSSSESSAASLFAHMRSKAPKKSTSRTQTNLLPQ